MSGKGRRFVDFADAVEHGAGAIPGWQDVVIDVLELLREAERDMGPADSAALHRRARVLLEGLIDADALAGLTTRGEDGL